MWPLLVVLALIWAAMLPPFFTDGACTAELQAESDRVNAAADGWTTARAAIDYWASRGVPLDVITAERCQRVKPRFLAECGNGPLLVAHAPVQDRICRLYRDDEIQVRLQFDERERLARITTVMDPFRTLPVPFSDRKLHWGR